MEASRQHGPFDTRWRCARTESPLALPTTAPLRAAEASEALDWYAFSDRYFRERGRHDAEALSAYAAYRQGREWRRTPARLRLIPTAGALAADEPEREEAGTRRLIAAMAAAHDERAHSHDA